VSPTEDVTEWTCPQCTYLNAWSLKCHVCKCERPVAQAQPTSSSSSSFCAICSDPIDVSPLLEPCNHSNFHLPCILNWLSNFASSCPLCRSPVLRCNGEPIPPLRQRIPQYASPEISISSSNLFGSESSTNLSRTDGLVLDHKIDTAPLSDVDGGDDGDDDDDDEKNIWRLIWMYSRKSERHLWSWISDRIYFLNTMYYDGCIHFSDIVLSLSK